MAALSDSGTAADAVDEETDVAFMRLAVSEAHEAMAAGEVPVGCVFVDRVSGAILARGGNRTNLLRNGTRHCEMVAMDALLKLHGPEAFPRSRLYVTLEPCIMCAGALLQLGVGEVVFGALNTRFGGCGGVYSVQEMCTCGKSTAQGDAPRGAMRGFQCRGGILSDEIVELLRDFYATGNPNAPEEKRHRPLQREDAGDGATVTASVRPLPNGRG
mmetsp:Transcript_1590/g.3291  ORF Transcript_1590/g.3291 Transcript_1590/m.3291 type:complete len:215 (+) Transcript_1590:97-741(+)